MYEIERNDLAGQLFSLRGLATYAAGTKGEPLKTICYGVGDLVPNAICEDARLAKTSRAKRL